MSFPRATFLVSDSALKTHSQKLSSHDHQDEQCVNDALGLPFREKQDALCDRPQDSEGYRV